MNGVFDRPSQAGISLLEVLISTSLLVLVVGAAYSVLTGSSRTAGTGIAIANTSELARSVLERAARELMSASISSFDPVDPEAADALEFQLVDAVVDGSPVLGELRALRLVEPESDPGDGIDNDDDGLVDEMQLVYLRDVGGPNEASVVWADGIPRLAPGELANGSDDNGDGLVDESGFSMTLSGRTLRLRIALERRAASGENYVREIETSVTIRN